MTSPERQQEDPKGLHPADMTLHTPFIDDQSQWMHMHTSPEGYDFFHPMPSSYSQSFSSQMPVVSMAPSSLVGSYLNQELVQGDMPSRSWTGSISQPVVGTTPVPSFASPIPVWPQSAASPQIRQPVQSALALAQHAHQLGPSSSRQPSPTQPSQDLSGCGYLNPETRTWTCAYPSCSSKAIFNRPCDLRKHFNRHSKNFYCRYEGCPQAREGGFSSKKDRARHESKHNPGVVCDWEGCERIFSRVDNMRNHMTRIHLKQKPGSASRANH